MTFSSIPQYDAATPGNNTDIGGVSIAEGWPAANINNSIRQLLTQLKQYLANSATVASASTVDLGAQTANYITISGTTTITAFGTIAAGTWRLVEFSGALTLTYNASSLILPGAANITTAAGDMCIMVSKGSGNWKCLVYAKASGLPIVNPTYPLPYSQIAGCIPSSIAGTNTTASMTISSGQAADSANTTPITCAGYSWAVSNGNAINGYQGGTTLPNSSTIHMFVCTGASGTGSFASTSLTPTLPTGYTTAYRRIFSFLTSGAGAPLGMTAIETEGGSVTFYLATQVQDISTAALTTSRTLFSLSVPSGVKHLWIGRVSSASANFILMTSPDETDVAPTSNASAPQFDAGASVASDNQPPLITNTSGQVGARSSAASTGLNGTTRGWKDFRRA